MAEHCRHDRGACPGTPVRLSLSVCGVQLLRLATVDARDRRAARLVAVTTARRHRRLLFVAAAVLFVVAFGLVGYRILDRPVWIYYYRVVDDRTLVLGTVNGPGANVRVTSVVEAATSVTITVSAFFFALGPSTDEGYAYESSATLIDPLGNRAVIDGSSGLPVRRATCPPPSYFAPVCP